MTPDDELISIFINKHYTNILNLTMNSPKSTIEICKKCGIPKGSILRLVRRLLKYDLLEPVQAQKKARCSIKYRSKIKGGSMEFDETGIRITLIPN